MRGFRAIAAALAAIGLSATVPAVAASCTVAVIGVSFGTYDTLYGQSLDGAGSLTVTCDVGDSFTMALSSGHGTLLARQMQNGTNVLYYNLYTNTLRSILWGDGSNGTTLVNGSGTSGTYTIYGRIPGGQRLPAGTYNDSITVTLTF